MSGGLLAAAFALLMAQNPAPPGGVADEADVLFSLGNQAYASRNYEEALSFYFASNRLAPNKNVTYNIARCYERLERPVEAYRYFARYRGATEVTEETEAAERAMARLRPRLVLLRVTSQPEGATVYLDRKDLGAYGVTPLELALAPGAYQVLLERAGHERAKVEVGQLAVGDRREVSHRLAPILGTLSLSGSPEGAIVEVDGEEVGRLPGELTLPPGRLRVKFSAPGFVSRVETVELKASERLALDVKLEVQTGSIVVRADESGLPVRLDGELIGFTPAVIESVPAGAHELSISAAGYRRFTKRVDVPGGGRAVVEASLQADSDVSAVSRAAEPVLDAPASVTLISKPELTALAPVHLMDALVGIRGFYPNDDLTFVSLGVRGFSDFGSYGNRVSLQLDGHTVNDDWLDQSFVGFDLLSDLTIVDRIEVVRGPGSSLYGTGAFLGVVNVGLPKALPHNVRAGLFTAGDGHPGVFVDGGMTFGEDAGFWLKVGGLVGQPFDYFSEAYVGTPGFEDGVAHQVGGLAAGGVVGRAFWGDLNLTLYLNQRNKNPPAAPFGTTFGDRRTLDAERRGFIDLKYDPKFGDSFQLVLRGYLDHFRYDGVFPYVEDRVLQEEYFEGNWGGVDARAVYRPLTGLKLTAGGETELHFINDGFGVDLPAGVPLYQQSHPYLTSSIYSDVDWQAASWLRLSLGARFDAWWITNLPNADEYFGEGVRFLSSFNPRFAAVLRPFDDTRFKLLLGRAFRAPSIFELTYWDGGITQVQSLTLEPETIYTGELEVSQVLPQRFVLIGAVYVNGIGELIRLKGGGNEADPSVFANETTPTWTLGAEVELRKELSRGILGSASYAFQRTRADDPLSNRPLPNSPEHVAGARLVLPLYARLARLGTRLYAEAGRSDRTGRLLDPAFLWDVTVSGELASLGVSYHVGVRNLLDWRTNFPVGDDIVEPTVLGPGRTFIAQVSYAY